MLKDGAKSSLVEDTGQKLEAEYIQVNKSVDINLLAEPNTKFKLLNEFVSGRISNSFLLIQYILLVYIKLETFTIV